MSEPAQRPNATEDPEESARRRPKGRRLRPLLGLLPFLSPYRAVVVAAFCALVASTAVMLVIPLAVRQVIDQGFSRSSAEAVDRYFVVLIGVAGVVAG